MGRFTALSYFVDFSHNCIFNVCGKSIMKVCQLLAQVEKLLDFDIEEVLEHLEGLNVCVWLT